MKRGAPRGSDVGRLDLHVVDLLTQGECLVDSTLPERLQATRELMALGISRAEIAEILDCGDLTVSRYLRTLMAEHGTHDMWDATVEILRLKNQLAAS